MATTEEQMPFAQEQSPEPQLQLIRLADLPSNEEIGGLEPTKDFVRSLQTYGLLSPIRVVREAGQPDRVGYGRRRVKAARQLGWETIRAEVVAPGPNESMAALQENIARAADERQEITAVLEMAARGASIADIRAMLPGRTTGQIKKMLRLRGLSPVLQHAVCTGRMRPSGAYAAVDLKPAKQREVEAMLADPKKVIGPADIEPLKRVQTTVALQHQFEDVLGQEVPSADDVARDAGRWQVRAAAVVRELLGQVPEDHPAYDALSEAVMLLSSEQDAS